MVKIYIMKNKIKFLITITCVTLFSLNGFAQGWMANSPNTLFTLNTLLNPSPIHVGIGLNNPNTTLHIHDNNTPDNHLSISGQAPSVRFFSGTTWPATGAGRIGFVTSPGDFTNGSAANDFVVQNVSSGSLLFGAGAGTGSERMRIDPNGQVGVNTTTPSAIFHTNGTVRHENLGTSSNTTVLVVDAQGNVTRNTNFSGGGSNSWLLGGNANVNTTNNILGSNVAGIGVRFRSSNLDRMFLTAGGFLGVNISAPGSQMHVFSNTPDNHQYVSGNAPSTRYFNGQTWTPAGGGRIGFATVATDFVETSDPADFIVQNMGFGSLIFGTNQNDDGDNGIERMRIDPHGQVGINTLTPAAILDVDCAHPLLHNPSEIRFQNLPFGHGNQLVIDPAGYVYQQDGPGMAEEVEILEKKVEQLEKKIEALLAASDIQMETTSASYVKQNVPNPSNKLTSIEYEVVEDFTSCNIVITDLNGKSKFTKSITATGRGTLSLDVSSYATGIYYYSLIIDGKRIDSKKMLIK